MFWCEPRTVVRDALSGDCGCDGYVGGLRGIGTLVNRDVVQVETAWTKSGNLNRM